MSKNYAIKVSNVNKSFILPHERTTSLKSALINIGRKRSFEKQQVLQDIDFTIKKGEFLGIVGRNGSGKSTLLKLLAGIYTPDEGSIDVNGSLTPFIELGVGFNPELTGKENVFLNGALLGFSRSEMNDMYDDIVEFAELERFMDQKLKNYSSGMQVRLAFSIAIRARSDILVLDEVLAVGDAAFQKKCYDYFMLLKKNQRTVVLVTHDMGAVRQYCDRAIMINAGQVVEEGDPDDVAEAYQRLFSDELQEGSSRPIDNEDEDRWGTGKMYCKETKIKVTKEKVTIRTKYIAREDLPAPILGFSLYSPTGVNLLEGNTRRAKRKTTALKAGETYDITWELDNIFATGNYKVSVACCDQSATEFYDWFNNAANFSVLKDGATAGMVDPKLSVTFNGE